MLLKHAVMGSNPPQLFVDECFACTTYTGNGSTQTITNGIDLAGKGGMVWVKDRNGYSGQQGHYLMDTVRGAGIYISTHNTSAQFSTGLGSFLANGYSDGLDWASNVNVASWTFRNAAHFYTHSVQVVSGSNVTVDLSTLGTVGMVRVKRTDSAGSWYIWHRSLTAGKLLIGETTAAEATLGHITMSGTTLTLVQSVLGNGTFLVEGFAHDTSA